MIEPDAVDDRPPGERVVIVDDPLRQCRATCGFMVVLYAIEALLPRTDTANESLASFPDISRKTPHDYAKAIALMTDSDKTDALAFHGVVLSRIAMKKFESITNAIRWLRGLLFCVYGVVLIYGARLATSGN